MADARGSGKWLIELVKQTLDQQLDRVYKQLEGFPQHYALALKTKVQLLTQRLAAVDRLDEFFCHTRVPALAGC